MIRLFAFVALVLCLSGCGGGSRQGFNFTASEIASLCLDSTELLPTDVSSAVRVDLNPFLGDKEFEFGDLVRSLRFIPLETTDASLLANIYKVVLTDRHVYVHDDFKGGGLVIFTSKGKFVRRISHGGGPGELYQLSDMAYDPSTDRLLVYQHPFLLFYTADGEYLEQKKLPFGFYNFQPIPGGYVFKTIDTVIQRGYFRSGHVCQVLYGSRNLFDWHILWSSTDKYLRGFRGSPYKYFRLALICKFDKAESAYGCSVQFTPRFTNKPR